MELPHQPQPQETLNSMQEKLLQQHSEIEKLQMQLKQEHFAEDLRKIMTSSAAIGLVLSPFSRSHLLETIVRTAGEFLHALSSSLYLIDEMAQDLVFEVAIGPVATEVKKFRVPLGHGFAGIVALTGQPMAIANAQQDARLATDIAFAVNYVPGSILCVPLFYDDRIIGVLEVFDKQTGAPFSPADMDILSQFAHISAVAIVQSNAFLDQQALFQAMIRSFSSEDAEQRQALYHEAEFFTHWANTTDTLNNKARELALCIHELILDGENSCELGLNMLQGIIARVRERNGLKAKLASLF